MKREIIFHDKDQNKVKIEIELKEDQRFSMSGEIDGSMGQCEDSIKPATPHQERLIEIWKKYHLNDMNAGTIKQEQILEDYKKQHDKSRLEYKKQIKILDTTSPDLTTIDILTYEERKKEREKITAKIIELKKDKLVIIEKKDKLRKETNSGWFIIKHLGIKEFFNNYSQLVSLINKLLKKKDDEIEKLQENLKTIQMKTMLYDKHPETGEPYQYGTAWLKRELPENLWTEIKTLCTEIEKDEKRRKRAYDKGSWTDLDVEIQVLGKYLKMTPKEAEVNITHTGKNEYTAEGIEYIVGTKSEIKEKAREYLTDDTELYKIWVEEEIKKGNAGGIMNIDDWADYVIRTDGYGLTLNGYDGGEYYDSDLELYVIRK
jgi:hypothetical protein